MGGVLKNSFSRWVQIMPDLYLKHSWLAFWTPAVLLHLYVCDSFLTTGQLGHCGRHCTTTKTNIFAVRLPSPPQHFGDSVSCIPGSSLYSQVLGLQPLHKQGWESNWRLNKRARQTLSPLSYNPSSPSTLCSLSYKMPAISWFVERRVCSGKEKLQVETTNLGKLYVETLCPKQKQPTENCYDLDYYKIV